MSETNSPTPTPLRQRVSLRGFLPQLVGNAALALLFIAWLQIPDSHTWEFVLSVLLIAALVAAFLVLQVRTFRDVRQTSTVIATWQAACIFAVWIVLAHIAVHLVNHVFAAELVNQRAGYWNSQLSPHQRTVLPYQRLVAWQQNTASALVWWLVPAIILPLAIESCTRGIRALAQRCTYRIYLRWQLWVTMALAAWVTVWASGKLYNWLPGHSARAELASLVLRFAAIYVIGVAVYHVVLAVTASLLSRDRGEDLRRNAAA